MISWNFQQNVTSMKLRVSQYASNHHHKKNDKIADPLEKILILYVKFIHPKLIPSG